MHHMKILLKEQISNFRFAIAKFVFLLVETKYKYIEDIKNSNLMLVLDNNSNEEIYISILAKPTKTIPKKKKVIIYYQSQKYKLYEGKKIEKYHTILKLSDKFDFKFEEAIQLIFMDYDTFSKKYSLIDNSKIYEIIVKYFFSNAIDSLREKYNKNTPYKYYSYDSVRNNNHEINDGSIAFTHPKSFNDPFDCNCILSNSTSLKDNFRVLCITQQYDNILMWSYYATNHTGFCFQYSYDNLIDLITDLPLSGICIFGKIDYNLTRPAQKTRVNRFSYTDLKFYIDAVFTKFKEWEHEREYRFVIISDKIPQSDDAISINSNITRIYKGCSSNANNLPTKSDGTHLPTIQLYKDPSTYRLTQFEDDELPSTN